MEKFVSYEKLSKKKKRELNQKRRSSWGGVNPVTRKPANPKVYNRAKARKWIHDDSSTVLSAFMYRNGLHRISPGRPFHILFAF